MKTFLLSAVLWPVAAMAANVSLELKYDPLVLQNGTSLAAATIKSYNTTAHTVMILAGRSLSSVQIEMLPPDVAKRVLSLAPPPGVEKAERVRPAAARQANARTQREERPERSRPAAAEADATAAANAAAEQAAQARYGHSSALGEPVKNPAVRLGRAVPVPGWDNRFRVTGVKGIQITDQFGNRQGKKPTEFEILIDVDAQGTATIVDFVEKESHGI